MTTLTLIRHATVHVRMGDVTFLVDPMLGDKEAYAPVEGTQNPVPWPLVGLPWPAEQVVDKADAVVLTHTHVDHLDDLAVGLVARAGLPVFCQPFDAPELRERGLARVLPVEAVEVWGGVRITRTGGEHGTGSMVDLMGPVSGWVFSTEDASVYIAGDTVLCQPVREAIAAHHPDLVVVNTGEARMEVGDPITMDGQDVIETAGIADGLVVAVHLETLNHCGLTRSSLRKAVDAAGVAVAIPGDGASVQAPRHASA